MFCKHVWIILDKTEFESMAERNLRLGIEITASQAHLSGIKTLFGKTVATILTCKKCGKLKRYKDII